MPLPVSDSLPIVLFSVPVLLPCLKVLRLLNDEVTTPEIPATLA